MTNTLTPPASASQTYSRLFNTAQDFINAFAKDPSLPLQMDFDRIGALCAPDFQHSFGHNYAVSLAPPLQGSRDFDGFIAHLQSMLPALESWETNITDVTVDETLMKVFLRISYYMRPKGASKDETVENDLLWLLEMTEVAGEVRISKSKEFVDAIAATKLKAAMGKQ